MEALMRHLFIALFIIFAAPYLIFGQQLDVKGGGEPPAARKTNKAIVLTRPKGQNLSMNPKLSIQRAAALPNRTSNISQISSFPFQEPFSTGSSYYESCPFILSNGDLFVVYANPMRDSLFSVTSTDNGTTWSVPSFVCNANPYCGSLSGVRTASGRMIIAWETNATGLTECYSDDGGTTWSSSISVTTNPNDYYTTLSQTLDGKVWLCYSRYDSSLYYDTFYRISVDSGASWSTERTFLATSNFEYYATIISKDSSTILAVYEDNSSGNYNLYSKTSTDGGTTWSSPISIESSSTSDVRPRVLRQSDGTLWLIYQHYKPSTGQYTQSEITYRKSTDGGSTWGTPSYFTSYAGYDGWFNACLKDNQPFVTFASYRWAILYEQTHLWYGLIGTSADGNPPPALEGYSSSWANNELNFQAYVDDETGISNVQLYYVLNRTSMVGPIQMYDDGLHNDGAAGDKIYGASIGPLQLGDFVIFSFAITDVNANTVNIQVGSSMNLAIQNVGNIVLAINNNSELSNSDMGAWQGTSAYWPKTNGYDYLSDGGLWASCKIGTDTAVVRQEYELPPEYGMDDWTRTGGTPWTLAPGVSDQDGDVTYDDRTNSLIGLRVHQQSYQWSDTTRDDFIIFKYTVANRGVNGTLNSVYIAQWLDPDVAIETNPANDKVGYDSTRHMLYMYNSSGNPAGYFGLRLLGAGKSPYTVLAYVNGQDPTTNGQHYQFMTQGNVMIPTAVNDYRFLLTALPISLAPNDSASMAYGIVLGYGLTEIQAAADTMEAIYESNIVTAVDERLLSNSGMAKDYRLLQNYPNPFNPSTTITYDVPKLSRVSLVVYDILGREVATLVDEQKNAGEYRVTFDGSQFASGVYFYKLVASPVEPMTAGNYISVKKLVLMK
jgi:hypothetical protein